MYMKISRIAVVMLLLLYSNVIYDLGLNSCGEHGIVQFASIYSLSVNYNYKMAQITKWLLALLDYTYNAPPHISMCMA